MALPEAVIGRRARRRAACCKSKSDARRQIEQGGVYVDGARDRSTLGVMCSRASATLQRGKRDKHVITVEVITGAAVRRSIAARLAGGVVDVDEDGAQLRVAFGELVGVGRLVTNFLTACAGSRPITEA